MSILSRGNAAKFYCLSLIESLILDTSVATMDRELTILDMGCGSAGNFVNILSKYPQVRYVGIEPNKQSYEQAQSNLKNLNATVINAYAYDVFRLVKEKFNVVVSFSVLEHLYKRMDYLRSAKECLKEGGCFLINYDAGHFLQQSLIEKVYDIVSHILISFGREIPYRSFVREQDFLKSVDECGFKIAEAKFFNTRLKDVFKVIPKDNESAYMQKWVQFELWLNELGIDYKDSMAPLFMTRNFILTH